MFLNKMNVRSFFQKKLKKMPRAKKLAIVPKGSSIPEIQSLERALRSRPAQLALAGGYMFSQALCSRPGPQVGNLREEAIVRMLQMPPVLEILGKPVRYDISNRAVEDMIIGDQPFSIKHLASNVGSAFKAKWTADADKAQGYINDAGHEHPHLLVMYVDVKGERVTAICIESSRCIEVIRSLGKEAFDHKAGTNNRGIPYSRRAMEMFLDGCAFCVEMEGMKILGGANPLQQLMTESLHLFEKPADKAADEVPK
jgi:hypothetical protein